MAERCMQEDFSKEGQMNVLTSDEIKPMLIFNEPFRPTSFAIIVVQKGSFVFQNNFVKNTLKAKDVYLVTPGSICELHKMSADVEFISMGFKREYLREQGVFLNSGEILHLFSSELMRKFSLNDDEFEELVHVMRALKRKINMPITTPYFKGIVRNAFLAVFYEILIVYNKNRVFTPVKLNRQEELTSDFLSLLGEHFKTEKSVQYYAKQMFVTTRYLSQVVKKVTGKTAGEIIDDVVIKEAKVLLSARLMNVSQVSNELQFSDQSFFGKFFKKKTGISPSIYRSNATVSISPLF